MHIEKIYELVRKEDVVLWIGSGFSIYAGYPNGKQLSERIYNSLSNVEKSEITSTLPLSELAEQHVRLKLGSKNPLITLLKKEFLKPPTSKTYHEILSNIPHIKTIVTTNYDRLFELAYKDEIQPIIFSSDIAYRNQKVELFKIHGDIYNPDTIVITNSDYNNFTYNNRDGGLIWAAIKERISNKVVVFVGYDLEDGNIKNVIREISETLGSNRKEMFLIAPNFKQHKIHYLHQLGIQYLNFKGEVFVKKLYENIKEHIASDFNEGCISAETLHKFFKKNNLRVDLKGSEDRFDIAKVHHIKQTAKSQMFFDFKNDRRFIKSFQEFIKGEKFGELKIEGSQLNNFKLLLNDINVISNSEDFQIILYSKPHKEGMAAIYFDDGSEFENIKYKVYRSTKQIEIVAIFKNSEMKFRVDIQQLVDSDNISGNLSFRHTGNFDNVNTAISINQLNLNLATGVGCKVFLDENPKSNSLSVFKFDLPVEIIKSNLDFFTSLKKVETLYGVRFSNFGDYSEEEFDNVYKAIDLANESRHEQDWDDELSFNLSNGGSLDMLMTFEKGSKLEVESQELEEVTIFNQKIALGYKNVVLADLYILNLDEVKSNKTSIVKVKSKSNTVQLYYSKTKRANQIPENRESTN